MRTKVLKTKEDYNWACERVYTLINSNETQIDPESKEGEEIELLSILIEKYEHDNFPLEAPDPIDAINVRRSKNLYNVIKNKVNKVK